MNNMNEENSSEWQAPPPPPSPPSEKIEQPEMSEPATLGNIFIEPGRTFEDLRRKPRFIIAGIVIALLVTAYAFGLKQKFGEEGMRGFISEQIDKSPQADSMSREQKESAIDLQMTIGKYTRFAIPVFVFLSYFIGGLLYWLSAKAFGGNGGYMQNVSVWVYAGFAPGIVSLLGSFVVMAFRSVDDIDLARSQQGLLQQYTNLSFLVGKEHPILATLISTFDVFTIWGWILAAIGLSAVNKMSKASAWTIVVIITVVGLGFRILGALLSGNPS